MPGALEAQKEGTLRSWKTGIFDEGEVESGRDETEEEASSQIRKGL